MLNIRKWLVILLDLCLVFSIVPINIFGEETQETDNTNTELNQTVSEVTDETEDIDVLEIAPEEETDSEETQQQTDDAENIQEVIQNVEEKIVLLDEPEVQVNTFSDAFANEFASQLIAYGIATESNIREFIAESESSHTIKVGSDSRILVLLSHMTQSAESNYCDWTIDFNNTGSLSLEVVLRKSDTSEELLYCGLGDDNFPFAGKLTGNLGGLTSSHTIFKSVSSELEINLNGSITTIGITWNGSKDNPVLANKVVAVNDNHFLNMPLTQSVTFSPYIGELTGYAGQLKIGTLNYSAAKIAYQDNEVLSGNLGLVCNHMKDGTSLYISQIITSENQIVDLRGSENVGVLVGQMDSGSTLTIGSDMSLNVKTQGSNAGGIVGYCDNGSILIEAGKNVTIDAEVTGKNSGAVVGKLNTQSGLFGDNGELVIHSAKITGTGTGNVGGLYGECTVSGELDPFDKVIINNKPELSAYGTNTVCGGLFGVLNLTGDGKCLIVGNESNYVNVNSVLIMANNSSQYGGVAGTISSDGRKNALIISYATVTTQIKQELVTENFPKKIGGLVVNQENNSTIDVSLSTVILNNPRTPLNTYGIGGLCTDIGDGALLIADSLKIVVDSFVDNQGTSGIAATTGKGTVVYLENTIDLSEAFLATCAFSGQIVGKQDCSLIYAPNVRIYRLKTTTDKSYEGIELDDIGNYGELYRIDSANPNDDNSKPFLTVDNNYEVIFNYKLLKSENGYNLSSKEDYACFALAWQSRGFFSTVEGVNSSNWETLKSSTITLLDDIDLSGTGIGGLTRDVYDSTNSTTSATDVFTGSLDGDGKKITLDIGASNVANNVTKGDGRIYWHNATGLFAVVSSQATIRNLKLEGNVRLSNAKKSPMYSGALSAIINGDRSSGTTLSAITSKVKYDATVSGGNQVYLGGVTGIILSGTSSIDFSGSTIATVIDISHSGNGNSNHIGGVIGAIGEKATATLTFGTGSLTTIVEGGITSTGGVNNLQCGSIVGTIFPSSSKTRIININNLKIKGYSITGSPSERMSGILGGIWANTEVTINGLVASDNSILTSNGTAEVGGLVYRASGKWTINNLDISNLTINANNAKALGLIVCHGETYNEYFNGSTKNTGALYLEVASDWETGYKVPITITYAGDVFDEFVAYTANISNEGYDITRNGSGVVSLKTNNNTINMTSGDRNTYYNRTTIGQSKQTNKFSRYYYNLKYIMDNQTETNEGLVNSASELLIWSVNRYADSSIQKYFSIKGIDNLSSINTIGGTSQSDMANFDMNGYSYYPIDVINGNMIINYANIKFYNAEIEEKENSNKSTIEKDDDYSQHFLMHCAIFNDFKAEKITETQNYVLTVNGVNFIGTIGFANGGSGALLCGNVQGEFNGANTAICKVVLADRDDPNKAITLNGISVSANSNTDYCPVLVNIISSYSSLEAYNIKVSTSQTGFAGSSLIGDVGSETAQNISISFAGTIQLPEHAGVFTKAILLNSLGYVDGSATYNFGAEKDNGKHESTHGKELTTSVEYEGKIGNYEAEGDNVTAISPSDGSSDFSDYLPYVANSPASKDDTHSLENNWHEIAVNIRSYNILTGCGTYGHPYVVMANEFKEIANFINTGKASNGWQVRIPTESSNYHSNEGENDEIIRYSTSDRTTAEKIRSHLRSAYYKLSYDQDNLFELKNFNGVGTNPATAFKGVIDGNGITVTLTGGSSAFVKYSYGSVVRNVTIEFEHSENQQLSLSWADPGRNSGNGTTLPQQSPTNFFGGVIGSILGGDNIIDGVSVNFDGFNINLIDDKSYLIPIGGYVGVVAGGGVIFRGGCDISGTKRTTYLNGVTKHLYDNPIIGRVLGGYAFYEGTSESNVHDNGDDNYKINKLEESTNSLSWDGVTLTINNNQGLLLLSAIVNSGAGSADSNAYKYGVARKAKYTHIGSTTPPDDYKIAKNDKENQISYLSNYVSVSGTNNTIRNICTNGTEGITVNVAKGANNLPITLDMTSYGNGYRGLSARYVSNAIFKDSVVNPYMVVMRVKTFDGQNATISGIRMNVEEYDADDFHMASMGGVFNIVWTKQNGGGTASSTFAKNLTISNIQISLKYINSSGTEQKQANTSTFVDKDGLCAVAVGGFIGSISDDGAPVKTENKFGNYLFDNIVILGLSNESRSIVYGPNSAGGIIGASAMTSTYLEGYPGILLSNKKTVRFGPNFLNCSYSNTNITGKIAAGGLVGAAYAYESTEVQFGSMGTSYSAKNYCFSSATVTNDSLTVGSNSTIKASSQHGVSAGLFGIVGMRSAVNYSNVNNESGLQIASKDSMKSVCFNNVEVLSSTTNDVIYRSDNTTVNGPDKSASNTAAGGIIGRISHVNQSYIYDVVFSASKANANTKVSGSYAGGIIAYGYTNTAMVIQDCSICENSLINGYYAGGLLGYGWAGSGGFNLHVSDCKISDSAVNGTSYSGGLVGKAGGKYYLTNILLKNTSITGHATQRGRLFGEMNDSTNTFYVKAAGISVYVDIDKSNIVIPANDGNTTTYNGYIAYADYSGINNPVANEKNPYVTVNPNFTLAGVNKVLTGDAVRILSNENNNVISIASKIWKDQNESASDSKKINRVLYNSVSSITSREAPSLSTFNSVQNIGPDNLPVLTIKGGDASVIEDYLNVITNGGYEKAKTITKNATKDEDKVLDLKVEVYSYEENAEGGIFVLKTKEELENTKAPASIYLDGNDIKVLGNSYDNTRNRFSLVEATFKTTVNGQQRTYTVSVPVVVIRELRYDFMATLTYGAEFQKTAYSTLRNHVLESAGNPITAFLSYSYNREKGAFVPYDWQSYIETGGNMFTIDKELNFANGLPKDTQLILVDCQNGNAAYQYKVSEGGIDSVRLSSFTSVSNGKALFSSMADILGVNVLPSVDGKFVKTLDEDVATVKLNGEYYRLYKEGEKTDRFNLTVPELEGKELTENYYLLINIPKQSGTDYFLNGNIESELVWNMPNSGTQVHRYDNKLVDNASNTESTYQIYSGYQQTLESLTSVGEPINLLDGNKKMQVAFKDTITFSSRQAYNPDDPLFAKFNVSLREFTNDSSSGKDLQFAVGTSGTAHFYIQDSSGKYYIYNGTAWSAVNEEREAASYEWISQGNNMELLLSRNGKEALDLAGVRQIIKDNDTLRKEIIITAKMDVQFNDQDVIDATVPASDKNGADVWAQLHYVAMLSAQESSLSYSNNRTPINDNAHYYRSVSYAAVLSLDAVLIDQLGVNPLQPVEDYMHIFNGKDAALIGLNADLDVKNLPDYENTLKNSKEIRFSLSLEKRNGGDDYVPVTVVDASQLIGFTWEDDNQDWSWSIPQSKYVENGQLKESDLYADGRFSFPIDAHVYVDPREFANYKIKLAVAFIGNNDNPMSVRVDHDEAYVVYTYACIKPTFYTFNSGN